MQGPSETIDEYSTEIINNAKIIPITDENLVKFAIIKGLRPELKVHVLQANATSLEGVLKAARIAEAAVTASGTTSELHRLTNEVATLIKEIKSRNNPEVNALNATSRSPSPGLRRVTFTDTPLNSTGRRAEHLVGETWRGRFPAGRSFNDRHAPGRLERRGVSDLKSSSQPELQHASTSCQRCGQYHDKSSCRAMGLQCFNCKKFNHLARVCKSVSYNPRYTENTLAYTKAQPHH